ncbi:PREDICTED: cytochrome P450 87A3-like [Tarenaya hassleriana]|uniref:cytochrome P450 87A3-like n=1 Tax=Tarenaya hassleriana TaxID=28532 RepID=UPI00053C518B|nr:PREDICTED: cytochrome P450 87A3-like [Tarenaya hassleriana]
MMWALSILASLLLIGITRWIYRWRNPKCNGILPPGSMALPLLGETLQFLKSNITSDIPHFVKERARKYGPIFKTSLFGQSVIVSTDAELNHFVFQQEGQLFQSSYPDTFNEILGRQNIGSLHGYMHKYIKNMILTFVGHEALKKMLPEIEQVTCKKLELWSTQASVELKDATAGMIFDFTAKKLISHDSEKSSENIREYFDAFIRGLISLPLNIPGTAYHNCLKGRERAMKMLKNMLNERRKTQRKNPSDFFDYVLRELQKEGSILTEEIALDLIFSMLFASFETTSLALTLAIKFLSDYPSALKRLTEEHEGILRNREVSDSGLTWEEYRSMTYTFQFINETARLANIAPVLFRKALEDTQFKGYTIPAGWEVVICPPAVHLNPDIYEDPLVFNPSRWEGSETSNASKHFMAFGGGMRLCSGTDFAKLEIAVFIHCLITKFRWNKIGRGDAIRSPGLQFPNGYHIQLAPKETA